MASYIVIIILYSR